MSHRQLRLPSPGDIDRDRRFRELNERILAAYLALVRIPDNSNIAAQVPTVRTSAQPQSTQQKPATISRTGGGQ